MTGLVLPLGILNTFRNWDGYNDMYALSTLSLGAVGALCFGITALAALRWIPRLRGLRRRWPPTSSSPRPASPSCSA